MAGAFSVHGSDEQIFGLIEQIPGRGQNYLSDISLKDVSEAKNKHLLPPPQSEEAGR
jgi:hypothetical protein